MPEVIIPANEDSVSVQIEAGEAGKGSLFVSANGYDELTIPFQVNASADKTESNDQA